jgi:hypothetical protein
MFFPLFSAVLAKGNGGLGMVPLQSVVSFLLSRNEKYGKHMQKCELETRRTGDIAREIAPFVDEVAPCAI